MNINDPNKIVTDKNSKTPTQKISDINQQPKQQSEQQQQQKQCVITSIPVERVHMADRTDDNNSRNQIWSIRDKVYNNYITSVQNDKPQQEQMIKVPNIIIHQQPSTFYNPQLQMQNRHNIILRNEHAYQGVNDVIYNDRGYTYFPKFNRFKKKLKKHSNLQKY